MTIKMINFIQNLDKVRFGCFIFLLSNFIPD